MHLRFLIASFCYYHYATSLILRVFLTALCWVLLWYVTALSTSSITLVPLCHVWADGSPTLVKHSVVLFFALRVYDNIQEQRAIPCFSHNQINSPITPYLRHDQEYDVVNNFVSKQVSIACKSNAPSHFFLTSRLFARYHLNFHTVENVMLLISSCQNSKYFSSIICLWKVPADEA